MLAQAEKAAAIFGQPQVHDLRPAGKCHQRAVFGSLQVKETNLAQFMISEIRAEPVAKRLPQFLQTFTRALAGSIIA